LNTTSCVSRWKITSLASERVDDLPGIGFPKWRVELLRIRNGKPGSWDVQWMNGKFVVDDLSVRKAETEYLLHASAGKG
jgi:protein ImuA